MSELPSLALRLGYKQFNLQFYTNTFLWTESPRCQHDSLGKLIRRLSKGLWIMTFCPHYLRINMRRPKEIRIKC